MVKGRSKLNSTLLDFGDSPRGIARQNPTMFPRKNFFYCLITGTNLICTLYLCNAYSFQLFAELPLLLRRPEAFVREIGPEFVNSASAPFCGTKNYPSPLGESEIRRHSQPITKTMLDSTMQQACPGRAGLIASITVEDANFIGHDQYPAASAACRRLAQSLTRANLPRWPVSRVFGWPRWVCLPWPARMSPKMPSWLCSAARNLPPPGATRGRLIW